MKRLEDVQAEHWCAERGLRVQGQLASTRVAIAGDEIQQFRVYLTAGPGYKMVSLAFTVLMGSATGDTTETFGGGLIWLQRWEIWSEDIDRVGYAFLGGLTSQPEAPLGGDISPAYEFEEGEFLTANAVLSLPLLFEWDAHFVPRSAQFIVFISHERHLDVFTRDQSEHQRLHSLFQDAGWSPTHG